MYHTLYCVWLIGYFILLLDNPAIYTPNSSILITSSTNIITATIKVYVDGSDPPPTPNNISWYHNDHLIHNTPSYMLTSNNTVLVIRGQGSSLIGSYTVRVMTTNGDSSVIVNVTYPGIRENWRSRYICIDYEMIIGSSKLKSQELPIF